jgi:hypothetical protein
LLTTSAILMFGAIAISLMTRDEWLALAHAAGIVGAVIAALGVLLLLSAGLRRLGLARPQPLRKEGPADHEAGQAGWE